MRGAKQADLGARKVESNTREGVKRANAARRQLQERDGHKQGGEGNKEAHKLTLAGFQAVSRMLSTFKVAFGHWISHLAAKAQKLPAPQCSRDSPCGRGA